MRPAPFHADELSVDAHTCAASPPCAPARPATRWLRRAAVVAARAAQRDHRAALDPELHRGAHAAPGPGGGGARGAARRRGAGKPQRGGLEPPAQLRAGAHLARAGCAGGAGDGAGARPSAMGGAARRAPRARPGADAHRGGPAGHAPRGSAGARPRGSKSRRSARRRRKPRSPRAATRLPRLEVQDLRVELVSSQDGHPLDLGAWDAQVEVSSASSARVLELAVQRDGGGEARSIVRWARDQPFQVEAGRGGDAASAADRAARPARRACAPPRAPSPGGSTGCCPRTSGAASSRCRGPHRRPVPRGHRAWRPSRWGRGASPAPAPWTGTGEAREVRLRDGHIGFGENDSLRVNLEGVYEGKRSPRASGPRPGWTSSATRTRSTRCRRSSASGRRRLASPGCSMRRVRVSGPVRDPEHGWRREARPRRPARGGEVDALLSPRAVHLPPAGRRRAHPGDVGSGRRTPTSFPISDLPRYVSRAVTTSEDAGFWFHPGFDFDEMKESLIDAAEGSRVRGRIDAHPAAGEEPVPLPRADLCPEGAARRSSPSPWRRRSPRRG